MSLSTAEPLLLTLTHKMSLTLQTPDGPTDTHMSSAGPSQPTESPPALPQLKLYWSEKRQNSHCTLNTFLCPESRQTSSSEVLPSLNPLSLVPLQHGANEATELKETGLKSREKTSCLLHSAPMNSAKENSHSPLDIFSCYADGLVKCWG